MLGLSGHDPEQSGIPPLLLIVFVENAFKHGVSYNHASFIHIRIGYRDDAVTAVISNSRHEKSRPVLRVSDSKMSKNGWH